ncbi:uncharacterized protein LOC119812881 [Arvicola amphibius]|uniref:uncharacterized protein LOC119812881 n=1 Tax=Arvicola amphibius TaxID=1047088 RepID=UPI001C08CF7B|nr:uncharacterized protein LOC119812881 [Arvicola amphibius]
MSGPLELPRRLGLAVSQKHESDDPTHLGIFRRASSPESIASSKSQNAQGLQLVCPADLIPTSYLVLNVPGFQLNPLGQLRSVLNHLLPPHPEILALPCLPQLQSPYRLPSTIYCTAIAVSGCTSIREWVTCELFHCHPSKLPGVTHKSPNPEQSPISHPPSRCWLCWIHTSFISPVSIFESQFHLRTFCRGHTKQRLFKRTLSHGAGSSEGNAFAVLASALLRSTLVYQAFSCGHEISRPSSDFLPFHDTSLPTKPSAPFEARNTNTLFYLFFVKYFSRCSSFLNALESCPQCTRHTARGTEITAILQVSQYAKVPWIPQVFASRPSPSLKGSSREALRTGGSPLSPSL